MKIIDNYVNNLFKRINFFDTWILRFLLGTAFCIHGYQALPIPSENLMKWFGFSPVTATFVPVAAIFGGSLVVFSGFLKNPYGNLLTRTSALIIVVYMSFAFFIAHKSWFITTKLFTSEQIFLFGIGLFFLLRGKTE